MKTRQWLNTLKFSLFCIAIVIILLYLCFSKDDHITYEDKVDFIMYDHIKYEETDYYYLKNGLKVPIECRPDKGNPIQIVIVDEEGVPMDATRTETAYFYTNDEENIYILYNRYVFTKDPELAKPKKASWETE